MLPSATLDQIDALIRRRIAEQQVPGASVAIIRDREPLFARGYGFADLGQLVPTVPETVYQIASLTKQFVAMLILMLSHDTILHLDDSISKWFPEGGDKWSMISVRHLMAHLSGLDDAPMDALDDQRDYSEDEMVAAIASAPLLCPPGTKWDYCNSGYVLLGVLIHRITGKHWVNVMRERIFDPINMTTARVVDEVASPNRAIGYEMIDGKTKIQSWISPSHNTLADGGLLMSANDFVGWSAGLGSEILLPQSVLHQLWKPVAFRDGKLAGTANHRFGLGWMLPTYDGMPKIAQHEGAWQGFSTYIGRLTDLQLTVVVLTNLDDELSKPCVIGREILKILMSQTA